MGYNLSATTLTLTAKLTPAGRKRYLTNSSNSLITSFSIGDSDANYNAAILLTTGQVPAEAGEIGPNSSNNNSTTNNARLKSVLLVNGNGIITKLVESQSSSVSVETLHNGQTTISGANLTQTIINRNDFNTNSLVNLYYSFGLPLATSDDATFTGITSNNGGFSDTAFSGLAQTKILAIAINNNTYGECIDGKELKMVLPTSAGTFTIYGTFQNTGGSPGPVIKDTDFRDTSPAAAIIDKNVVFLFSDSINTPNSNTGLTWSTGFGLTKPFSLNGKQLYNLTTNTNLSLTADTIVGVAYLDKGFVVITHPTIVSAFTATAATATTVTFNSVSTAVYQNITCIADRGEFGVSTNPTFGPNDVARISEVALYDNLGTLIAVAKTDRHVPKTLDQLVAFGIKINL